MANGISSAGEYDLSRIFANQIVLLNFPRQLPQTSFQLRQVQARDRAPQQFGNVRMSGVSLFCRDDVGARVGPSSFPLRGGDQQIVEAINHLALRIDSVADRLQKVA